MRHRKIIQNIATTKFRTFCKHCTLHGLFYFSEERHWMVYTIWMTIITSSVALCLFLSNMIWEKFIVDPTFTVVETTHYSTTQIPYPAVTICDTELVYGPNTDNITNILELRSFDREQIGAFYESFTAVRNTDYVPPDYLKKMHKTLFDLGYTYDVLLEMFSKPCDVLMVKCTWRSEILNCADMFHKVNTVAGYCCQFDMKFFRQHTHPDTNFLSGVEITEALSMLIDGQKTTFNGSVSNGYVWMYVYDDKTSVTPADSPTTLTPGGFFDVNINVWIIDSSEDVKSLNVKARQCYIDEDLLGPLSYYFECISVQLLRRVVRVCRCLPFNYSAKLLQVEDYPKCPWERLMCVYQTLESVKSDIKDIIYKNSCLQRCDYVQYATEIEYIRYQRKLKYMNESMTTAVVHFSSTTCLKYKREVIYSWDQMLANLGGIFGLCLGGSVISLIEIVWFAVDFFVSLFKARFSKTAPKKKLVFTLTKKDSVTKMLNGQKIEGKYKFVN